MIMGVTLSSCGVYGILLTGQDAKAVRDIWDNLDRGVDEEVLLDDYERGEKFDQDDEAQQLVAKLCSKYGAGKSATIYHTGSVDDRFGNQDEIDPDLFILGYGLYQFPKSVPKLSTKFTSKANWYVWIEAYS